MFYILIGGTIGLMAYLIGLINHSKKNKAVPSETDVLDGDNIKNSEEGGEQK